MESRNNQKGASMRPVSTLHLQSYIDVLLGKTSIEKWRFGTGLDDSEKYFAALDIIRYGVEEVLKWTPQEVIRHMTPYIARSLHWDAIFKRQLIPDESFVRYDIEDDHDRIIMEAINYRHLMSLCYPDQITFNFGEEAVEEYRRIMNAKRINADGGNAELDRFRRDYVLSTGVHRNEILSALFKVIVFDYVFPELDNKVVEEMGIAYALYSTFANTTKINSIYIRAGMYDIFKRSYPRFYDMLCEFYSFLQVEDDLFWRKVFSIEAIMSGAKKKHEGKY